MKIKSPCKLICKYNEDKLCIGCLRTSEEISKWINYSDEEKVEVLKLVEKRKGTNNDDYYGFP